MDTLTKNKQVREIRNIIDGYLKAEKELNETIDGKTGDYGLLSDREKVITTQLDNELNTQSEHLAKRLKDFGYTIHPIELIDIYSENRLKAIQILEA